MTEGSLHSSFLYMAFMKKIFFHKLIKLTIKYTVCYVGLIFFATIVKCRSGNNFPWTSYVNLTFIYFERIQ